jgi:hypothetical protein
MQTQMQTFMPTSMPTSMSSSMVPTPCRAPGDSVDCGPQGVAGEPVVENEKEGMRPTMRFTGSSAYQYTHESLSLKYTSSDGDTLELTAQRETLHMSERLEIEGIEEVDGEVEELQKNPWDSLNDVMSQVKNEMRQQQLSMLKSMLGIESDDMEGLQGLWQKLAATRQAWQNGEGAGLGEGMGKGASESLASMSYAMDLSVEKLNLSFELITNGDGRGLDALLKDVNGVEGQDENGVPEYWNAENTSNRIVDFAMGFAELHGEDFASFIAQIRDAIDLGFAQASQMSGPLTGSAGKLNQDTHQLVHDKLDRHLADRETTPYNHEAKGLEWIAA